MTNEELARLFGDTIATNREVIAVLDQSFRWNVFWATLLLAVVVCTVLFAVGLYIAWHLQRNSEIARLRTKGMLAVNSSNAYRDDYFWARRRLDNMTALVEQIQTFLKNMGPRFGHEPEHQRLIEECEASLQGPEQPVEYSTGSGTTTEPEIMPQVQEEHGDRAVKFLTALRERYGAKQ